MNQFNRNVDSMESTNYTKRKMAPMWGTDKNTATAILPEQTIMPFAPVNNRPVPQFQNGRVIGV